jgi:hypothetical protein
LDGCGKDLLREYMGKMIEAIKRKKLPKSEEFILNAVSCATNLLFYDMPAKPENEIFLEPLRI